MAKEMHRREFLESLGITIGGVAAGASAGAAAGYVAGPGQAHAQPKTRTIPTKPLKTGHMTFFTGAAAVLGEQSYKGHILAEEEINAQGGLLGKRKIETIKADEAAGTDANVKELKRMALQEKIDLFTGVISSGNTPALGPVAEELGVLTIFTDGCTDFLFDKAVPNPHFVFRITNIQSADGVTCAIATAMQWPKVRTIAHIHPDYSYGRNALDHFTIAIKKLLPDTKIVYEGWPKLGTTDFTTHIPAIISAKPDLLVSALWGGDYVAFYKQALGYGLFKKMKFASMISHGIAPHALGKDHPEGTIAGHHANYYFTYPAGGQWPPNTDFIARFRKRWNEYPNFEAEGAYVAMYLFKAAVERAAKLVGGWPEVDEIIGQLEGLSMAGPGGYIYIRPDNHQGYKDAVTGISKNVPEYPFNIVDPKSVIHIPIQKITAPPGWPKGEPTSTYTWIEKTWPKAY